VNTRKGTRLSTPSWPGVFGDAKMTTMRLDRFTRHGDIVETESWRFETCA